MTLFRSVLVIRRALVRVVTATATATPAAAIQQASRRNLVTLDTKTRVEPRAKFAFNLILARLSSTAVNQKESNNSSNASVPVEAATKAAASTPKQNVIEDSKLIVKQRPPIKKKSKKHHQQMQPTSSSSSSTTPLFKVRAFATADYYDLEHLRTALESSGAYKLLAIDDKMPDSFVCAGPKYAGVNEIEPRHIFFFLEGTVVFWNLSSEEQNSILDMLHKYEKNPYPSRLVRDESEVMEYSWHHVEDDSLTKRPTRLVNSHIYFESSDDAKHHLLEKYAFSDAMSLSVKLGIWEQNLDEFSEHIGRLTDNFKSAHGLKIGSEEVLKNLGELLTMRHVVNLDSHFLDSPDFYWDRETLEPLYSQLVAYFTIPKRTRLFNDKLNHCIDLMGILKQHLSDKHHVRLEWIIIWLIFVEVLIGLDVFVLLKKSIMYLFGGL